MILNKRSLAFICSLALAVMGSARADPASDMQEKLDALQRQIQELQAQMAAMKKSPEQAAPPTVNHIKPGNDLTFQVGGGEVTIYGHADVSLDSQTNGMSGFQNGGLPVTGNNGWLADISSNLSFFGIRAERSVDKDLKGVLQFETEVSYAATPGASDQGTDGTAQKFSLGSRNSYVGLQSKTRPAASIPSPIRRAITTPSWETAVAITAPNSMRGCRTPFGTSRPRPVVSVSAPSFHLVKTAVRVVDFMPKVNRIARVAIRPRV